jgi:hypothetical protein
MDIKLHHCKSREKRRSERRTFMAAVGRPTIRTDESIRTAVIDELKWDLMSHCGRVKF